MYIFGFNFQRYHWLSYRLNLSPQTYNQCKRFPWILSEFITALQYFLLFSDDAKDADSLSDEVTHNSNQNNSNCSSPSRMSDSVSLNTDSSQDTSLCSPVKQTPVDSNSKVRSVCIWTNVFTYTINRNNNTNNKYRDKHKWFHRYISGLCNKFLYSIFKVIE